MSAHSVSGSGQNVTRFPLEAARNVRVLVVGDIMLDRYWFGKVDRISPEAPVPVVHVARREDRLGGAANVARNARALGARVSLFGLVGNDEAGERVRQLLDEKQIVSGVMSDDSVPTVLKMRVLGRQQQLLRIDFEQTPCRDSCQQLYEAVVAAMPEHDIMVLSDYNKGVLQGVEQLISAARQQGLPVLVDPKGYRYERYHGATIMTPNRVELRDAIGHWTDEADLVNRAQALRTRLGMEALLVTRSEEGMSLFTEAGIEHVQAWAHEVFDVSGAGDTVLATLAVAKAAGLDWAQAMYWANRAGGVVVGKLGTSIITPKEMT